MIAVQTAAPMTTLRSYERAADIPFAEADGLLHEYGRMIHGRAVAAGCAPFDYTAHIKAFWDGIDMVLPPKGSYLLAWTAEGRLLGSGALRRVDATTGEMKHLYVRPEARGEGLGRRLVERRIEDARALGLKTLIADTFAVNVEMPALYDGLGFQRVDAPDVNSRSLSITPALREHMIYFRYDL